MAATVNLKGSSRRTLFFFFLGIALLLLLSMAPSPVLSQTEQEETVPSVEDEPEAQTPQEGDSKEVQPPKEAEGDDKELTYDVFPSSFMAVYQDGAANRTLYSEFHIESA